MKKIFGWVALLMGMVTGANAQVNDTIQRTTGNDLYQGITRKLPYRQMVTPHGVQVTFAKTVHIIFPSAVRYVDLGSDRIIAGKADGAENVIRVKATTEGFPGETNFSVICEDGSFYSFNARYAHEPEMLNIEMKDFLENGDTTDFSHTRMNIHFRELAGESPLLVKLIMQSIYKEDRREIRHLGCKRFGVQFLLKSVHSHNGLFYFHTETRNRSNVAFRTDFIRVQGRGQESAEAHRHSGTGDRSGAQLQRGAGDGGEKRRAHGICRPAVHHTGRQAAGHRSVREGRRQAPDHPGGERRPRGGKTD